MKFEITESLKDKCLSAGVKLVIQEKDCLDCHIIDDVAFCYDGDKIYAIVATPVEEFDDTKRHKGIARLAIEAAVPKYLSEYDRLGEFVFVDVQVQILSEHRAFCRVNYNF